jgi:16S rRNA (cytosine1402-N4)-methyltransferase
MQSEGAPKHIPVLSGEAIRCLSPAPGGVYLDGTVGEGGHAEALLEASSPGGRLVGIDLDPGALARAAPRLERFAGRFELLRGNFRDLPALAGRRAPFQGILLDLGMSSCQLDDPARGLSFRLDGPLDMRLDPEGEGPTAADLVNGLPELELRRVLRDFGEERFAGRIARRIVAARAENPLKTSSELADLISRTVYRRGRIHPATRSFQALRIAVNREMENLEAALAAMPALLAAGGTAAVISFHSLEDRRVKRAFRAWAAAGAFEILTPKPRVPGAAERGANPRARSAKLRAARKVGES